MFFCACACREHNDWGSSLMRMLVSFWHDAESSGSAGRMMLVSFRHDVESSGSAGRIRVRVSWKTYACASLKTYVHVA